MGSTEKESPLVIGPAARMRCRRCGRVFTVRPGQLVAHDRRQGAIYVHCDGLLAADVPGARGRGETEITSDKGASQGS